MAPNKKYLSLEEAAVQLGLKPDELIRLREKGEVRGFADRGTWKFKADDVAEFRRRRQPDSDPDLPIMDDFDEDENEDLGRQATVIRKGGETKSDSDVRLSPSTASKKSKLTGTSGEMDATDLQKSDSDVRLVEPTKPALHDSESDVKLVKPKSYSKSDSDSDVKMVQGPISAPESDSDVKLLEPLEKLGDSDSDVRLAGSDSDVRLAPLVDSDSDVKLIDRKSHKAKSGSDSDVVLLPRGSTGRTPIDVDSNTIDLPNLESVSDRDDFPLGGMDDGGSVFVDDEDSSIAFSGDSGIRLSEDSGIQLAGESGIRLAGLSGIRLGGDSGIRLADDSGVQLKQPADSGISLEGMDSGVRIADSGITLGEDSGINLMPSGSSKKLKSGSSNKLKGGSSKKLKPVPKPDQDDLDSTSPLLLSGLDDDDDFGSTSPLLRSMDSGDTHPTDLDMFEPNDTSEMSLGESGQNVVMFDDDEDESPTPRQRKQKTVEESIFEMDDSSEQELEELEVSDDDLSGDHEMDDLAFDDGSEELDESFTAGTSQLGYGAPQKVAIAQEVEWTAGFCLLLFASVCFLIVGSMVSADLLKVVWDQSQESNVDQGIAWLLAGFWK